MLSFNLVSDGYFGANMKFNNLNQTGGVGVSVAIATYNGAKYLKEQLESIAKQTVLPNEIIISDDCSTDNTREVVESFVKNSAIPVRFLTHPVNIGIINNFFNAFNHCTGDYIFYCDQDDVWMLDKVEQCLRCFQHSSQIKLVIHQNNIVDENLKDQSIIQPYISQSHTVKSPVYRDSVWGFGHQMVFHRSILPMLAYLKDLNETSLLHVATCFDFSIIVAAGAIGDIYLLKKPLVFFRRHSNSTTKAGKANEGVFIKAENKNILNNLYVGEIEALIALTDSQDFQKLMPVESLVLYKAMLSDKLIQYKKITQLYTSKSLFKHLVKIVNTVSYGLHNTSSIKIEIAKNIFYASLLRVTNK